MKSVPQTVVVSRRRPLFPFGNNRDTVGVRKDSVRLAPLDDRLTEGVFLLP